MQRSAHKATASSPSTPNGPPSKKARLSNGQSAPGTPGTPDHEILQSALAAEEKKRQEALEKAAQHAGETKWVLSFTDPLAGKRQESLQVKHAGFAEIDAVDESDEEEEEVRPIRKQFGGGVKRKEVRFGMQIWFVQLLTYHRSPSSSRTPRSLTAKSNRHRTTTTATTQPPNSFEKPSVKWPQRIAKRAILKSRHEGHRETRTGTLVFMAYSRCPVTVTTNRVNRET